MYLKVTGSDPGIDALIYKTDLYQSGNNLVFSDKQRAKFNLQHLVVMRQINNVISN